MASGCKKQYPVPVDASYGSMRREAGAGNLLPEALFRRWKALTHSGFRFDKRCVRCEDVITPPDVTELEEIFGARLKRLAALGPTMARSRLRPYSA